MTRAEDVPLQRPDHEGSCGVCRLRLNKIKVEKAKTSQMGDQISQKYLPLLPLVMGIIEQASKVIAETAPIA
jgi:hypothetical protein